MALNRSLEMTRAVFKVGAFAEKKLLRFVRAMKDELSVRSARP